MRFIDLGLDSWVAAAAAPHAVVLRSLATGCAAALAVLGLRGFPTTVALFSARCPAWQKAASLAVYLVMTYLAARMANFRVRDVLVAYASLLALSAFAFALSRRHGGRALLLPVALGLFFIVPAVGMPGNGYLLLLGWEMVLSSYSYCVDAPAASRSFEGYLFFVFVNPTLAYPRRGTRAAPPGLCPAGLWRIVRGAFALVAAGALLPAIDASGCVESGPAGRVVFGLARGVSLYGSFWGLGAIQVGLFRQLGYVAPAKYRQPYLATSPRDFWARWNTYVGAWARFYLFEPCVRSLHSRAHRSDARAGSGSRSRTRAIAVMASFLGIGALHDLYASFVNRAPTVSTTAWFAANALAILAWDAASRYAWRGEGRTARAAAGAAMVALMIAFAVVLP